MPTPPANDTLRTWSIADRARAGRRFLVGPLEHDSALRLYAWAVLAAHAVVWLFFVDTDSLRFVVATPDPICWPFFEECTAFRPRSIAGANAILAAYSLAVLSAAWCLYRGRLGWFWLWLFIANVTLTGIVLLDYRLRANQFYMLLWLNAVFLFAPERRSALRAILISFYFWAGVLKLNREWLSGSGLYSDLWWIPQSWTPAACAYVVVLEMVVIWGLLARSNLLFWTTAAQLALFHVQSLSQIHWFYPALMIALLSWFMIDRRTPSPSLVGALGPTRTRRLSIGVLAAFAACQIAPSLYPGRRDLTGQGRVFALHMFEARQVCVVEVSLIGQAGVRTEVAINEAGLSPRLACDPVVYFNKARNMCTKLPAGVSDLDLRMDSRRTTESSFTRIVDAPRFCSSGYSYRVLSANPWMR